MRGIKTMKNKKVNIPIRIASVMLCLVLFSLYMTSGMFAKYTTGGNGKGNGRVAKFSVTATDAGENVYVFDQAAEQQPDGSYTVTIKNDSEVAVRYTIILKFDRAIPDYLTITPAGFNVEYEDGRKVARLEGGDLIPNNDTVTKKITFGVDYDKFVDGVTLGQQTETLSFDTIVRLTQID